MSEIIKATYRGAAVDVPVCWSAAQVAEVARLHPPDGVVDVDDQKGPGTLLEQKLFKQMALDVLEKQGRMP